MERCSLVLQDHQDYVQLLDALTELTALEPKQCLQKTDTYVGFIHVQAGVLLDRTIAYSGEEKVSFRLPHSILIGRLRQRVFS